MRDLIGDLVGASFFWTIFLLAFLWALYAMDMQIKIEIWFIRFSIGRTGIEFKIGRQ